MAAGMLQIQTKDHALGLGVIQRRTLTGEVRQDSQAFTAGRNVGSQLHHLGIHVASLCFCLSSDVCCHVLPEPAGQRAGTAHTCCNGIGTGEQVRTCPQALIGGQLLNYVDNEDGRTVHQHHITGIQNAYGKCFRRCIGSTGGDGGTHGQTGFGRCFLRNITGDLIGPAAVCQLIPAAEDGQILFPIQVLHRVDGYEGGSGIMVDGIVSGELCHQIGAAGDKFVGLCVNLRFLVADPEDLCCCRLRAQRGAAAIENGFFAIQIVQIIDFIHSPAVDAVEDGLAQRIHILIHRQAAGTDGAGANAGNVLGVNAGLLDQSLADGAEITPPGLLCIVLGIAGLGNFHLMGTCVIGNNPGILVHQGAFAFKGADVDTHKVLTHRNILLIRYC